MPFKQYDPEAMDAAAKKADQELRERYMNQSEPTMTALELADWLRNHFMSAGYKRLCRVIKDVVV